jgi:hypothetical protein
MKRILSARFGAVRLLACFLFWTIATQTWGQAPTVTIHSGLPANTGIKQIVHGKGIFMANLYGYFYTSANGVDWQQIPGPTLHGNWLNPPTLAFGAGKFVCVGDSGAISTSTDGLNWTERRSGTTAYLRDVKFLNGSFYAVGDSARFLQSPGGLHWQALNIGIGSAADHYSSVDYGNGYYIVNASTPDTFGITYRSAADTVGSWTADSVGYRSTVFFVKQYFYRIGPRKIESSTDAATWTTIPYFATDARSVLGGFNDSSNIYLVSGSAAAGDGQPSGYIYPSTDGLNFSTAIAMNLPIRGGLSVRQHDYIYTDYGALRSSDGVIYKALGMNFQAAAFHNGVAVGVGYLADRGLIRRTTDFVSWKDVTPDSTTYLTPDTLNPLTSIVYDGTRFVAGGYGTDINGVTNPECVYTSPHGVNWATSIMDNNIHLGGNQPLNSLLWTVTSDGRGIYYCIGYGDIFASPDLSTWYPQGVPFAQYIKKLRYVNGNFFALGMDTSNGYHPLLLTGSGGGNIFPNLPFNVGSLDDIIYDGSKYVLMGTELDSSGVYPVGFFSVSSTDLSTWGNKGGITSPPAGTVLATGGNQTFAYANGHYVGGASAQDSRHESYLIYSDDAVHWNYQPLGVSSAIAAIDTSGPAFRMVGSANVWLTVGFSRQGTHSAKDSLAGFALPPTMPEDARFRVYPNPAASSTTVILPGTGAATATLYNNAGVAVMKKEFNDYTVTLPLMGLPSGVYRLTVRQNGQLYTRAILHL